MLLAVILNIGVSIVTVSIRLAVVIFVPIVDLPQSSLSLPSPCLPSLGPYRLILPTPVQVDSLEFLLSGLQPFHGRSFERGFHCIMKVLESRLMPPIYFPSWTTQRWSMPNLTRNPRLAVWLALFITLPFIHLEFLA